MWTTAAKNCAGIKLTNCLKKPLVKVDCPHKPPKETKFTTEYIKSFGPKQYVIQFTNLKMKSFISGTSLNTTRSTTITLINQTIVFPSDQEPQITPQTSITTMQLISQPQGAKININKLCPKCHQPQKDFNSIVNYHRSSTCKILRATKNYIKNYIKKCSETISRSASNSTITKFVKYKLDFVTCQSTLY
ncbi:malate dehydrogenase [Labeo rohita]|uniref:Malate dehydrogenase n=1 Tax=Labeo rohita TaxID=84645 RepID=A0ABQ8MMP7_LABRO|nr:malate dehydrogenase [Labeo rohita]